MDLREWRRERALARAMETEEGDEEVEKTPLVWKAKKMPVPEKRK